VFIFEGPISNLKRLHTESSNSLWPTAVFTHVPLPYQGEFSRFRPASGLLKIGLSKLDSRCCQLVSDGILVV